MFSNHFEARMQENFFPADVRINGSRSWDINVYNDAFYSRVLRQGSVGLGESAVRSRCARAIRCCLTRCRR
jgi:cyclopropane-fatty-acyl-phospholipid synthase